MSRRARLRWVAGLTAAALVAAAIVAILVSGGRRRSPRPPRPVSIVAGPPGLPAPTGGPELGANVNELFNSHRYDVAAIAAQLRALRRTGATIARTDVLWEVTQPTPGRLDWSFDDLIARSLAAAGLKWLPIIDYAPGWAQAGPPVLHGPPRSPAAFAAFARAFAERYGPGGGFWRSHPGLTADPVDTYEIWNEPDNPEFWVPRPDPARYAELYLASRGAIKAVDPAARVIVGGLTKPVRFLPRLVKAHPALVGHVDGVAIHPYGRNVRVVLARVRGARAAMRSLGLGGVPLYVTEFGWTTRPPGGA